ncbi:phosphate acyltransferase PlsX [Alterinioella nitratireducens]|uniref:phosphate acyltransferase PlsX n=1 Tax=Alterinioella nitratireducens TaxID=2735915 RepID=UPI001553DDC2|nr:phosphate acyltransferase PlsX [Alterinioella nitratireducens]NPD19194.1 phosphate acyltransferase PlsX [Alterinioella nitratireducens]|tara:strand:+ start:563 stop:1654 length:1092 start_codon:yes stop_codon:yes gene_type:complete
MADTAQSTGADASETVLSIDAMGGDKGPSAVVDGIAIAASALPSARFIVHGDEARLTPLIGGNPGLADRCTVFHADKIVSMDDKPSQVMRSGRDTSMWSAIESVRSGEASAVISCGNTGALMAMSMLRLRKIEGVNRPAIACLWPSRNPGGFNVMLDAGADIRADENDLLQYALMGASYARNGLGVARPRVGLLNVGTEEFKGRAELKLAAQAIARAAPVGQFDYVGFVEGGDMPSDRVDVIVTDGFTGNVALKTGEGIARLVRELLEDAFRSSWMSRLGAALAMKPLRHMSTRIDPRQVNGGLFLGLNGTVVKSHGASDGMGVSAGIKLAAQLSAAGFNDRLAARIAASERALTTEDGDRDE